MALRDLTAAAATHADGRHVDPIDPQYTLPSHQHRPFTPPAAAPRSRCLDLRDIDGTAPTHLFPYEQRDSLGAADIEGANTQWCSLPSRYASHYAGRAAPRNFDVLDINTDVEGACLLTLRAHPAAAGTCHGGAASAGQRAPAHWLGCRAGLRVSCSSCSSAHSSARAAHGRDSERRDTIATHSVFGAGLNDGKFRGTAELSRPPRSPQLRNPLSPTYRHDVHNAAMWPSAAQQASGLQLYGCVPCPPRRAARSPIDHTAGSMGPLCISHCAITVWCGACGGAVGGVLCACLAPPRPRAGQDRLVRARSTTQEWATASQPATLSTATTPPYLTHHLPKRRRQMRLGETRADSSFSKILCNRARLHVARHGRAAACTATARRQCPPSSPRNCGGGGTPAGRSVARARGRHASSATGPTSA